MLVLTRKLNESIMIGHDVKVTIVAVKGDQVKLGISAPRDIAVHREEIYLEIVRAGKPLIPWEILRELKSVVKSGWRR